MANQSDQISQNRIVKILYRIEDGLLIAMLLAMIGIAVLQIVLRNVFSGGISWGDPLVRMLVLWTGLIGASVASRTGSHINIDVITRYLPKQVKTAAGCIVNLFTAAVCFTMTGVSLRFVKTEYDFAELAFANVPSWLCQSSIPASFLVIGLRYLILAGLEFRSFLIQNRTE